MIVQIGLANRCTYDYYEYCSGYLRCQVLTGVQLLFLTMIVAHYISLIGVFSVKLVTFFQS